MHRSPTRVWVLGLVIITFTSSACSEHPRREDVLYVSEVPSQVRGAVGASLDPRGFISGWAGAPDKPSHVVDVHVYIDGDASQRDHYVGRVRANLAHAEAAKAMRSDGQYGFRFVVPARFRDGAEHTAYVYAINPSDATVTLICPDVIPNGAFGATSLGEVQAIRDTTRLAMPNVFSPNGDGVNDLLAPILAEGTATYILQIFDRWGNKVFDNAGSSKPWDGRTSAGYECKEGVYFYLLTTTAACNGGQDERHGTVQLLR